jgi:hypothetical protein
VVSNASVTQAVDWKRMAAALIGVEDKMPDKGTHEANGTGRTQDQAKNRQYDQLETLASRRRRIVQYPEDVLNPFRVGPVHPVVCVTDSLEEIHVLFKHGLPRSLERLIPRSGPPSKTSANG